MDNIIKNIQRGSLSEDFCFPEYFLNDIISVIQIIKKGDFEISFRLNFYYEEEYEKDLDVEMEFLIEDYLAVSFFKNTEEEQPIKVRWVVSTRNSIFKHIENDKRNLFYRASLLKKEANLDGIREKFLKSSSSLEGILNILFDSSFFNEG
jgi:hypothetical protein